MRHAIHSGFLAELKKFSNRFTFKSCIYNSDYVELDTWPSDMTAQEAKDYLADKGISVVILDTDGTELDLEAC